MANGTDEKRGSQRKISRDEWDNITNRYEMGESLARIGREYNCTAPAIRYIIQKHRASVRGDGTGERSTRVPVAESGFSALPPPEVNVQRPIQPNEPADPDKVSGHSFDTECLRMVILEFSEFLVASDAVVVEGTPEAFDRLRERTDSLLRLAARVRIEVERSSAGATQARDEHKIAKSSR
jgi:transposase-like protein